jgi:hypothetical protein
MNRRNVICAAAPALALALALTGAPSPAAAAPSSSAERALAGKVALTGRALPGKKGEKPYLRALGKSAGKRAVFHQDRKSGAWTIHYAAVVRRPMRDVTVKIFDVTRGQRYVGSRDKMLFAPSTIVNGSLTLDRDDVFDPNARMMLLLEAPNGTVLARRTFYIQGRAQTYSGVVEFTADEAPAAGEELSPESVRSKKRRN